MTIKGSLYNFLDLVKTELFPILKQLGFFRCYHLAWNRKRDLLVDVVEFQMAKYCSYLMT